MQEADKNKDGLIDCVEFLSIVLPAVGTEAPPTPPEKEPSATNVIDEARLELVAEKLKNVTAAEAEGEARDEAAVVQRNLPGGAAAAAVAALDASNRSPPAHASPQPPPEGASNSSLSLSSSPIRPLEVRTPLQPYAGDGTREHKGDDAARFIGRDFNVGAAMTVMNDTIQSPARFRSGE
jgi:hypothetical protein